MCFQAGVFLANSHVQNNVQNKNYFSGKLSILFGAQLSKKNDLFLFPLFSPFISSISVLSDFHLITSMYFWDPWPQCHFQATLFRPYWPFLYCLLLKLLRLGFLPSLLVIFEQSHGLSSSSVKGGCSQCLGPVPGSVQVRLSHLCTQAPPPHPSLTPRLQEGGRPGPGPA